jgi:transcription-repair coupling factor (superfamily II helicase)
LEQFIKSLQRSGRLTVCGAPEGFDAVLLGRWAEDALAERGSGAQGGADLVFVARDEIRAERTLDAMRFFAPTLEAIFVPAWDCLPYDRVSPRADIVSRRIQALSTLLEARPAGVPRVAVMTVSAIVQRVPPREWFAGKLLSATSGQRLDPRDLVAFLGNSGYRASEMVMEPGEFVVRGGIVDVFAPGHDAPARLDFFGDELEGIRVFDATTQRTTGKLDSIVLKPVNEFAMDEGAVARFREGYRTAFATAGTDDPLYTAVSAGRRHLGMEHWLPLLHERLESLFDYLADAPVVFDYQADEARAARFALIDEYYEARLKYDGDGAQGLSAYRALPPDRLYLRPDEWDELAARRPCAWLSPFAAPEAQRAVIDAGARPGRDFAEARVTPGVNLFDALGGHVKAEIADGRRVILFAHSAGSAQRLRSVLGDHGLGRIADVSDWAEAEGLGGDVLALAVAGLDRGFTTAGLSAIAEQDILGERLVRRASSKSVKAENVIAEASSLAQGDLVVHMDHGIGRYEGLVTIEVAGAPHDCLRVHYAGEDKLFLPVENIEMLSRYGSDRGGVSLDRLGGAAWQARKARMKQRIRDMAAELIKVAAKRAVDPAPRIPRADEAFDEFCARFPYDETEDQSRAIDETLAGLESGVTMDRLICGDVGFGKTEVALRAAFATVMAGKQVAVVVPTTLLARQHNMTFTDRFAPYPVQVGQLSRLVSAKRSKEVRSGIADGTVDIAIGTHALLADSVRFRDLGLLVVDEEQHFGVAHKEKLKKMKAGVHVLTLSATPIPRTLQMALAGVRELSLIATPPVDRLAVRTFVLPYDPVVIREAILRERERGGQTFYVCPRIADIDRLAGSLRRLVPEVDLVTAHGRMAPRRLEDAMAAFYDGAHDVLLSTNIIESGLDLPAVNTIVIHRADLFGLAQLYQLRGRVGRSKIRAYAYLTLPPGKELSKAAARRLEVMQTLDSLGAGFTLASYDLDIRGAGNLLGAEQSGHIREVGIELYQHMLEEAVTEARGLADGADERDEDWSPQISIGIPVRIPERYVAELGVRLGLYRRIATLSTRDEIDAFAAELIDRFGNLPDEVDNLLETVAIKGACRAASADKVEAGPKGAVVSFRGGRFPNPAGLVEFITAENGTARLRPDHRLVYRGSWHNARSRLAGVRRLMTQIADIAAA